MRYLTFKNNVQTIFIWCYEVGSWLLNVHLA